MGFLALEWGRTQEKMAAHRFLPFLKWKLKLIILRYVPILSSKEIPDRYPDSETEQLAKDPRSLSQRHLLKKPIGLGIPHTISQSSRDVILLMCILGCGRQWLSLLGPCHPTGRPGVSSGLWASTGPSLCCCRHLVCELADGRSLFICIEARCCRCHYFPVPLAIFFHGFMLFNLTTK